MCYTIQETNYSSINLKHLDTFVISEHLLMSDMVYHCMAIILYCNFYCGAAQLKTDRCCCFFSAGNQFGREQVITNKCYLAKALRTSDRSYLADSFASLFIDQVPHISAFSLHSVRMDFK